VLVLEGDASLEDTNVLLPVEQEEIPDLVQVDLPAGPVVEAVERLEAAQRDRDVELVRELRAHASRGAARGARRQRVPLDEQDVAHPSLREMERDARAHHAAADDHHLCARRKRHSPVLQRPARPDAGRTRSIAAGVSVPQILPATQRVTARALAGVRCLQESFARSRGLSRTAGGG